MILAGLGSDLRKNRESQKTNDPTTFLLHFWALGGCGWSLLGTVLGDLGYKFGHLGRFGPQVGIFLATCWHKDGEDELRYASWLHLGLVLARFWSPGRVRPGLAWNGKSEKGKQPLAKKSPKQCIKC